MVLPVAALLLTACGAGQREAASRVVEPVVATGERPPGGAGEPAGNDVPCRSLALSIPAGWTGRPTPRAAAEWSAADGDLGDRLPAAGWADSVTDESGARVRSGSWTLHVVRLPDGTWAVDSGTTC